MNQSYIAYLREMVSDRMVILNGTAVVIVNEHNQVLLQKRSDSLSWGLPGGLLELNERIEHCAIREVKEETNLDIQIQRFIGVFTNPLMRWHETDQAQVICFAFLAKAVGGDMRVNDSESIALEYFDYEQLPEIHTLDNRQIIDAYYHHQYNLIEGKSYHENE